jgi:hypothetical protein
VLYDLEHRPLCRPVEPDVGVEIKRIGDVNAVGEYFPQALLRVRRDRVEL